MEPVELKGRLRFGLAEVILKLKYLQQFYTQTYEERVAIGEVITAAESAKDEAER